MTEQQPPPPPPETILNGEKIIITMDAVLLQHGNYNYWLIPKKKGVDIYAYQQNSDNKQNWVKLNADTKKALMANVKIKGKNNEIEIENQSQENIQVKKTDLWKEQAGAKHIGRNGQAVLLLADGPVEILMGNETLFLIKEGSDVRVAGYDGDKIRASKIRRFWQRTSKTPPWKGLQNGEPVITIGTYPANDICRYQHGQNIAPEHLQIDILGNNLVIITDSGSKNGFGLIRRNIENFKQWQKSPACQWENITTLPFFMESPPYISSPEDDIPPESMATWEKGKSGAFSMKSRSPEKQGNQDLYKFIEIYFPLGTGSEWQKVRIFLLTDGVGGNKGGNVASKRGIKAVEKYFTSDKWNKYIHGLRACNLNQEDIKIKAFEALKNAIEAANKKVHNDRASYPFLKNMGATIVAAAVINNTALILHAGDSRGSTVDPEGVLVRQTSDHALSETDPGNRNTITRALGQSQEIELTASTIPLEPGTIIALYSDGVVKRLGAEDEDTSDAALGQTINKHNGKNNMGKRARAVVKDLLNNNGEEDDTTLVLAMV